MKAPQHIAFIPDGNRTWAKQRGLDQFIGHLEGFRRMMELAIHIFTKSETKVFTLW
jgi:di-trans,poly-cis-decaprenylcistransferase